MKNMSLSSVRVFYFLVCAFISVGISGCGGGGGGTPPKTWGTTELIETDDVNNASEQDIAFDPNGNALAVWSQGNNLWANYYNATTATWGTAELIESLALGLSHPAIAMDANGNGIAIWSHNEGAEQSIYANYYTVNVGWGTEELIENNAGSAFAPQIAFDSSGDAIAVWEQPSGGPVSIWANHYDAAGAGWTAASAALLEAAAGAASAPQLAVAADGSAFAIWPQHNGVNTGVYAAKYSVGGPWGAAEAIETDATDSLTPQIAIDSSGNAIAVWVQPSGGLDSMWANTYTAGSWDTAGVLESDGGLVRYPYIAFDASDNAMAIWRQNGRLKFNQYTAAVGWGTIGAIESGTDTASFPQFAMNSSGNAVVTWRQDSNGVASIWANDFQPATGWGTAGVIETSDEVAYKVSVAIDVNGNALAILTQDDTLAISLVANRFD